MSDTSAAGSNARVIVRLQGGLGNQLFQIAAARALAPTDALIAVPPDAEPTLRHLLPSLSGFVAYRRLMQYGVPAMYRSRLRRRMFLSATWPIRQLRRDSYLIQGLEHAYDPPDLGTVGAAMNSGRRTAMVGYFQHPDWTADSADGLASMLAQSLKVHDARQPTSLAVHFRRGDYVGLGHALHLDYYRTAIVDVLESTPIDSITIVGLGADDSATAEIADFRKWLSATASVPISDAGGSQIEDFRTIATAGHVVASNSTFCWWACVTGDQCHSTDHRRVAYPHRWTRQSETHLGRPHWQAVTVDW